MKNISNISQNIKKILVMLLLVVFLSACGDKHDLVKGNECGADPVDTTVASQCIDTKDAGCLGCSIFTLMFNAVSTNVMRMHGHLTGGAMAIMMVCFSIWLAIRLLKFVSSVSESSVSQVWNEILKQGFLCVFCGILASSPTMLVYAVNTFVYPIYVAFLKLGVAIMETSITDGDTGKTTTFTVFGQVTAVKAVSPNCTFDKAGIITEEGFPQEFLNTIKCMIMILKEYLGVGAEISYTMMKQTGSFTGVVAGAFLIAFFWIVRIGFVFYLVDTIFQMGIVILVLPIFIMAYAFNKTRAWTNIAIKNILASAGFLMCFSIIVTLVLRAMIEMIINNPTVFNPQTNAEEDFANLSIGFLCLILIGFLIYGSMGVTQQITGSLIGGQVDNNFQDKLTKVADMVKGWAVKGLMSALSFGMSLMPQGVQDVIHEIEKKRDMVRRWAGRKKDEE